MSPTQIDIHIEPTWRLWRLVRIVNADTGATAYACPFVPGIFPCSVERALDRVTA